MPRFDFRLFTRRLALLNPFRIAHGTYTYRDNVFVRFDYNGAAGMGEAPVVPYYGDTVESILADLRASITPGAVRMLFGLSGSSPERVSDIESATKVAFSRKASQCAFETAVLDLKSRLAGMNLSEYLGIEPVSSATTSYTIPYNESVDVMISAARGHRCLKVKLGFPGDVERVVRLREAYPDIRIRVDANQGWSLDEAIAKASALLDLDIELIEEPLGGSLEEIEAFAASTSIPVVLDEHAVSLADIEECGRVAPSVSGIVVKLAKSGGPARVLEIIRKASEMGLRIMISSMVETSLGATAAAHLMGLCEWCDIDTPLLISDDPFTGVTYAGDTVTMPEGIGVAAHLTHESEFAGIEPEFSIDL